MKKFFNRLATRCVTAYANRIYKQCMTAAEARYEEEKDMIFVITDPSKPMSLMTLNTAEFLDLRHRYQIPSKSLPVATLKNQCWYHTASKVGKDVMSQRDIMVRKLAFLRELLTRAKLA